MDNKQLNRRLLAIGGAFALCLIAFIAAIFDAQIVHGEEYLAQSIRANTSVEAVETSRGIITDRNGKVIVSNRSVYTLELVPALASSDSDALNAELMRLIALLRAQGVAWTDALPLGTEMPLSYDFTRGGKSDLIAFLAKHKLIADADAAELPVSAAELLTLLRTEFRINGDLSSTDARALAGLRYTLAVVDTNRQSTYPIATDIDVVMISLLKDGGYQPVTVGTSSVREYHTDAAAHILGRISRIYKEDWPKYKEQGYSMDALVGTDGVELAFEDYLRGRDGKRLVTTNSAGKVTSELYSVQPEPGDTVSLTLDIDFQEQVEAALADTVQRMTAADGASRGAAAAVVQVGTGEVLALASYPTFSLKTYNEDYQQNAQNPLKPFWNRATQETYAPGSTFKPLVAVAALESGVITPYTKIHATGVYTYYDLKLKCWIYSSSGGSHGDIDVSEAIKVSCNYFFYDVGRKTGISTLARYASAFGLGEPTGIEIPENIGVMTTPEYVNSLKGHRWTDGQTLTAAIGQSYSLFTPLQLANYIAALCDGGTRYNAHLLKNVKAYDNSSLAAVYDEPPAETISIADENLQAVLRGMHELTQSGSVAGYFKDCIVDTGAKTGTVQTGRGKENGVFVCFAPYDDPQIAVACVIEKGGSGGALASTVVNIVNAYFSVAEPESTVQGENILLK